MLPLPLTVQLHEFFKLPLGPHFSLQFRLSKIRRKYLKAVSTRDVARMRSEGCICKEPVASLHLPRQSQHSSEGNDSAELDFCPYKTNEVCEECVAREMCWEGFVTKFATYCSSQSIDGIATHLLTAAHFHSARHPRTPHFPRTSLVEKQLNPACAVSLAIRVNRGQQ